MFAIIHSEDLLDALRAGNADAFRLLVRRHDAALRHVAMRFVADKATAEEVVQDTWLVVIDKLDTFEGRSSLKAWVFAILANIARTRAKRDARRVFLDEATRASVAVDADRFESGHWTDPPQEWALSPEDDAERKQLVEIILTFIEALPDAQAAVMRLRDVEGLNTREVAEMLGIETGHVRVLLHRARTTVRNRLEQRLAEVKP